MRLLPNARSTIALLWIGVAIPPVARAVEVASDASASRDFVYLTTDARQDLLDGKLGLAAGYALVSDLHTTRHGARVGADLDLAPVAVDALATWGPAQAGRGWLALELHAQHRVERGRVAVITDGTLTLRRADVALGHRVRTVDQIEGRLALALSLDGRWELGAEAALAGYDPDLASRTLRGADAGLLVSFAGRPTRWAAGAHTAVDVATGWRVELGALWVSFADGRAGGVLPRVAVRSGPWRWITVEAGVEVLALDDGEAPRCIGTLGVEVAP